MRHSKTHHHFEEAVDPSEEYTKLFFEKVASDIRSLKKDASYHEKTCLEIFDGFLWGIDRAIKMDRYTNTWVDQEKLRHRLDQCRDLKENAPGLQCAAMEIGFLAPPGHASSITVLSTLLSHSNKYVRYNACRSLGLIGGPVAIQKLEELTQNSNHEIAMIATSSLRHCRASSLASMRLGNINKQITVLRELLCNKYRAQTLFLWSGGLLIAFLANLVAWYSCNIFLVHPALSFIGALAAAGFAFLSLWRWKWS